MTTCIGAICQNEGQDRIIQCADKRIGVEGFAYSETGFKLEIIGPRITAMIAGTVPRGKELCAAFDSYFIETKERITKQNLLSLLKRPPKIQKQRLIDDYLGNSWGISQKEFLDGRLKYLPDGDRSKIAADIRALHLECSLVICAFVDQEAFLFTCDEFGTVLPSTDFAVIGSGWTVAQANMYRRHYIRWYPLEIALYAVYESKKFTEIDPVIGSKTTLLVLSQDGPIQWVSTEGISHLDERLKVFFPSVIPDAKFPQDFFKEDPKPEEGVPSSEAEAAPLSIPAASESGQEKAKDGG